MTGIDTTSKAPFRSLRSWLRHLAATDQLAIIREDTPLEFKLAAIAKRLDGSKATLFPKPGGHAIPVVSGLISSRAWIAEALGGVCWICLLFPTKTLRRAGEVWRKAVSSRS